MEKDRGIALIFALGVLALLLAAGVTFLSSSRLEERAAKNYLDFIKCDLVAKAAAEHAFSVLMAGKNEGVDSPESRWRTEFSGRGHDNSGDGEEDSAWIELTGADGEIAGRYAVLVEDESGKINVNHSGNLSARQGPAAPPVHGRNEGWSTYEISIGDVLASLGISDARGISRRIVRGRYGGYDDAGGYGFNAAKGACGIDIDAGGGPDYADPVGFTPWKPALELAHNPFVDLTQVALGSGLSGAGFELFSGRACAYSRSPNMYFEGGERRNRVNINAFTDPSRLYSALYGVMDEEALCRYVVNILDYRDENLWVTEFVSPVTGNRYYGAESVLVNEVLSNSYAVDATQNVNNRASEMSFTYSGLAPETAYRVTVVLYYRNNPASVQIKVGSGNWQSAGSGGSSVVLREIDYNDFSGSITDSNGDMTISTRFRKTRADEDSPPTGTVTISRVYFVAAEFIELVNIGREPVDAQGWEIKTVSRGSENIREIPAGSVIEPGEYLVLTNDGALFSASYPGVGNVLEMGGWDSGYKSPGEFPEDGDMEILVYIDREKELIADLVLDGESRGAPGMSVPGESLRPGASREKRDPALRSFWFDNYHGSASPGEDNSIVPRKGLDALERVRDGGPALVRNGPFASPGQLTETRDWRKGGIRYPGVSSGAAPWQPIPPEDAAKMAGRISAGHYLRFDGETAERHGSVRRWPARLDRNFERAAYQLFFYGDYTGNAEDIYIRGFGGLGYGKSGGVYAGELSSFLIGKDGSLSLDVSGDFEYILLVPDSVNGKININTASREVLTGLPAVCPQKADMIINSRRTEYFTSVGELLARGVLTPAGFAPVANLVSVNSDVFRVICTARVPHPSDVRDPELFLAEKKVEAVADRSGGRLRILSWREINE